MMVIYPTSARRPLTAINAVLSILTHGSLGRLTLLAFVFSLLGHQAIRGQTYEMDIGASVNGVPIGLSDTIWANAYATFDIYFNNSDSVRAYSTGFTIWSDDGMDWRWDTAYFDIQYIMGTDPPEFDTLYSIVTVVEGSRQYPPLTIWGDGGFTVYAPDTNGTPRDSILFGSEDQQKGMGPGPLELQAQIHFRARGFDPLDVKTICIDSTEVGAGGDFVFVDVNGQTRVPTTLWPEGGRCWTVKRPPNNLPVFTNCPVDQIMVDHCGQANITLSAEDSDWDSIAFAVELFYGLGPIIVDQYTGELTYWPVPEESNDTVIATIKVYDQYDPNGTTCDIHFFVTNEIPIVESCPTPAPVVRNFQASTTVSGTDPDLCDEVYYLMKEGPGEIGFGDGNYIWNTEVSDTLGSPHTVVIGVTDGFDTADCSFDVDVYAPSPVHITDMSGAEDEIYDAIYYGVDSVVLEASGVVNLTQPFPVIWWPVVITGLDASGGPYSFVFDGLALSSGNGFDIACSDNRVEGVTIRNFPENGIAVSGPAAVNNTFTNNLIYGNGLLGIDLGDDGITPNAFDNFMDYPELDSIIYQGATQFTLYGRAQPEARVELYVAHRPRDVAEDPTDYGEGYEFLDSLNVDLSGEFSYLLDGNAYPPFTKISSLATDAAGNTSEFSHNAPVRTGPFSVIAYSPVNIIVTDPLGRSFGWDADGNLIDELGAGAAAYFETPDDSLIIYNPELGDYNVSFVTQTGATPGEIYSSIIRIDGSFEIVVTSNQEIPPIGETVEYVYELEDGFFYTNADANGDEGVNVGDVVFLINHIFHEGPSSDPTPAGDANCDMRVNIGDAVYLINHIFHEGAQPCEI